VSVSQSVCSSSAWALQNARTDRGSMYGGDFWSPRNNIVFNESPDPLTDLMRPSPNYFGHLMFSLLSLTLIMQQEGHWQSENTALFIDVRTRTKRQLYHGSSDSALSTTTDASRLDKTCVLWCQMLIVLFICAFSINVKFFQASAWPSGRRWSLFQ